MIKFLEKLTKIIAMAQIALLPVFIFGVFTVLSYSYLPESFNLIVSPVVAGIGIIVSVCYAVYIDRKYGAIDVISRVSATPELDSEPAEEKK